MENRTVLTGPAAPQRETQVNSELIKCRMAADSIEESIAELFRRLDPIRSPKDKEAGGIGKGTVGPMLVPLAQELCSLSERLISYNNMIMRMISELEI